MSIPDELIMSYFLLCTGRGEAELKAVEERLKTGENPRDIKAELAKEVIAIYHSAGAAEEAAAEFDRVFRQKELPDDMPEYGIAAGGINIVDLIVSAGLLPSKSEARRKLSEGAVYLDGERVDDMGFLVRIDAETRVLKVGKRRFLRLVRN